MLVTVQHPFADSRLFLPRAIRPISRPTWPSPSSDEFVRHFGGIRERRCGGLDFWGEDLLCDVARGIRFESLQTFYSHQRKFHVSLEACFRRLYGDGSALGKLEIGVATRGRNIIILPAEVESFIQHILSLRLAVPSVSDVGSLGQLGRLFVSGYVSATTRVNRRRGQTWPSWAVESGSPLIFIQAVEREIESLPFPKYQGPDLHKWGLSISCCEVPYRGKKIRAWVSELGRDVDRTVARALRLSLLRLHAERECIRLVCRNIVTRRLILEEDSEECELIQSYLNEATKRIARNERTAKRVADGCMSIVELTRHIADTIKPGEADSLLQMLAQASLRKNIIRKLASYTNQVFVAKEINMAENVVYGGAGAVGTHATATNTYITNYQQTWAALQSEVDTSSLAPQLDQLLTAMRDQAKSTAQFQAVADVSAAKDAAETNDSSAILKCLKSAGSWALEVAEKISADIAAKVISAAMGLPAA